LNADAQDASRATMRMRFREFAEHPLLCGISMSVLMGRIAELSEGVGRDYADPRDSMWLKNFGGFASFDNFKRPRTVCVRAGGRGGKSSRLAAPKAIHAAWTVPLPDLGHGEIAGSTIVAPTLKLAKQTLSFVSGYIHNSSILGPAVVKELSDSIVIRRPDGKLVSIDVRAADAKGGPLRSRTLVYACLEEAAIFRAFGSGAVNDQEIYNAASQRVVPDGQLWIVSTPWLKGIGILEEFIEKNWGKHETALVCCASTRELNPGWDPDGVIERTMREQNPDAARMEIDGIPMAGAAVSFFDPVAIEAAIDKSLKLPREPLPGEQVTAGADFGFRRDASALVVCHRSGSKMLVGDLHEMRPVDEPLKPSVVVRTFAERVKTHSGVSYVVADGHYRESVVEHLGAFDLGLRDAPPGAEGVSSTYVKARNLFRDGRVRIPNHPRLISQLRSVAWRANMGGTISIILPREQQGGHCDLVSALVLALWEQGGTEVEEPLPAHEAYAKQHWNIREQADEFALNGKLPKGVDELELAALAELEREEQEARYG